MPGSVAAEEAHRPKGRTLKEFGKLQPAEAILCDACAKGVEAVIRGTDVTGPTDVTRPTAGDPSNRIRSAFLRFLALGGDAQAVVHEKGVVLKGAWIDGELDLEGCYVPAWLELVSCTFEGCIVLRDAEIRGLNLTGSCVAGIKGDRMHSRGVVALSQASAVSQTVEKNTKESDPVASGNDAVTLVGLAGAEVAGNLLLNDFRAKGKVDLTYAKIGGNLDCAGAYLGEGLKNGTALAAQALDVKGQVFLNKNFQAKGKVDLTYAKIGGNLDCAGADLNAGEGPENLTALAANSLEVRASVFLNCLNGKFHTKGKVDLSYAKIGGSLDCAGADLDAGEGPENLTALAANSLEVSNVFLNNEFHAKGQVDLSYAKIASVLDCVGGHFEVQETPSPLAIDLQNADIKGYFRFYDVVPARGLINLANLHVGTLHDKPTSWPELVLDGFRYNSLESAWKYTDRIQKWLGKQKETDPKKNFKGQPWDQLVKVLRESGYREEAEEVAIEKQRRKGKSLGGPSRFVHWLYGLMYGFGYRPRRVFVAAFCVWGVFALLFQMCRGVMVPTDSQLITDDRYRECRGAWTACPQLIGVYPTFSAVAYSLDYVLPIGDLSQKKSWTAMVVNDHGISEVGLAVAGLGYLENLFGWLAGGVLAAVMSGLLKKD
jgi:hypothetical protein